MKGVTQVLLLLCWALNSLEALQDASETGLWQDSSHQFEVRISTISHFCLGGLS